MLSYLDTIGRLTELRDSVRTALGNGVADREMCIARVESTLTKLLGELVTPDETPKTTVTVELFIGVPGPDVRRSACRTDLWLDPVANKYVALFDAPCPSTVSTEHIARR